MVSRLKCRATILIIFLQIRLDKTTSERVCRNCVIDSHICAFGIHQIDCIWKRQVYSILLAKIDKWCSVPLFAGRNVKFYRVTAYKCFFIHKYLWLSVFHKLPTLLSFLFDWHLPQSLREMNEDLSWTISVNYSFNIYEDPNAINFINFSTSRRCN